MPIYDYRCDHCGHVFSAVQSFKDEALDKCPNCGKKPRRLLSTPAIVFKGSGWYITDSRKATSAAVASDDSSAKSETKPTSEAKTTSESPAKSEATSDTKSNSASTPAPE